MTIHFNNGPIIAISTPVESRSALGIVRVSGFSEFNWLREITGKCVKHIFKERVCYFSKFKDDNNGVLDEGLFTIFKAPHSFTGENVAEFSLHGNPIILDRFVCYLMKKYGFLLAKPGEFSYRALKNKKLNLTQVESLDLLLNSNNIYGVNQGLSGLNNELYKMYTKLRDEFIEIRSCFEILMDFSEDVGEEEIKNKIELNFQNFSKTINRLYQKTRGNINQILNPKISLVGSTNAGKSTFFNKLLNSERAIVSSIEGTTRDYISDNLYIDGICFNLVDTAGLRGTSDEIEKIGIKQTLKINEDSFYRVLVINPFADFDQTRFTIEYDSVLYTHADIDNFELKIQKISKFFNCPQFVLNYQDSQSLKGWSIVNLSEFFKKDESGPMGAKSETGPMGAKSETGPMGAKSKTGPMGATIGGSDNTSDIVKSNTYEYNQKGFNDLESDILRKYNLLAKKKPILIDRHRNVISDTYNSFNELTDAWKVTKDLGILSSKCSILSKSLDELIGVVSPQDVLDNIFSNFCIGK